MTATSEGAEAIGGRCRRVIGAVLLINFVAVCGIKVALGCVEEIWWMSHVGLLLAAISLIVGWVPGVMAALTCLFVLHSLWMFDCLWWMLSGVFPLGITNYLAEANALVWVGTLHHFYLMPLLLIVVHGDRRWPVESFLTATALFLFLTVVSRAFLSPAMNVNYAFGVFTALDHPLIGWINRLPGSVYLVGLNVFVSIVMFLPTTLLGRAWAHRTASRSGRLRWSQPCSP